MTPMMLLKIDFCSKCIFVDFSLGFSSYFDLDRKYITYSTTLFKCIEYIHKQKIIISYNYAMSFLDKIC